MEILEPLARQLRTELPQAQPSLRPRRGVPAGVVLRLAGLSRHLLPLASVTAGAVFSCALLLRQVRLVALLLLRRRGDMEAIGERELGRLGTLARDPLSPSFAC